jgi:hypothetical protein
MNFTNGTMRVYYPAPSDEASEEERATAPEYMDKYLDGSFVLGYLNGTIAQFSPNGFLIEYIRKPEFFYGEMTRQDFADGSFALFYPRNKTARVFPAPLPATATKK